LTKLGERNSLVKEFVEKVMKLNKIDLWMFGVTAEQDRNMIFNSRLREATKKERK